MMRHARYTVLLMLLLGSAVIGGLLTRVLLGTVADARAQPTLPDGAFVQGQDETRWVVGNGRRFRMAFVNDDAGVLPTLPEGGIVASACEASAAVAGTNPAACSVFSPVTVAPVTSLAVLTPSVVPPFAPPAAPVPEGILLLDAVGGSAFNLPSPAPGLGAGSVFTQTFVNNAPRELELCWEVTQPATANLFVTFTILERTAAGDRPTGFSAPFNRENGCTIFPGRLLPAGTYVIHVTSSFPSWRVTVRAR